MRHVAALLASAATLLGTYTATAAEYDVGPTQTYKSPCALLAAVTLAPGDLILVDAATYTDVCPITQSGTAQAPLVMMGAPGPRPVFDASGTDLTDSGTASDSGSPSDSGSAPDSGPAPDSGARPTAIFQFTGASHWRVSHLELKNAAGSSGVGAAFHVTADSDDVVVSDSAIHDCAEGLTSDGSGTFTLENSEVFHNGANDGQTHNVDLRSDTVRLVGNYIHDSNGGQNVELRVHYAEVLYNFIANAGSYEMGLVQGSPLTDEPDSNVVLIGNVVVGNPKAANGGQTILFGSDDATKAGRNGSLYAFNNTFVMTTTYDGLVRALAAAKGAQILFSNNIVHATVAGTMMYYDGTTAALYGGTNNWVTEGIETPLGIGNSGIGPDPGFVCGSYHLTAFSPPREKGTLMLTYLDGAGVTQNGLPTMEFAELGVDAYGTVSRLQEAAIDDGAFEYGTPNGGPADGGAPECGAPEAGEDGGADGAADARFDVLSFDCCFDDPNLNDFPPTSSPKGGCSCVIGDDVAGTLSATTGLLVLVGAIARRRARKHLSTPSTSPRRSCS